MPLFVLEGIELDLPRNLAILDSNILIALALPNDASHDEVEYFIETQDQFVLGVPPPVIAEACSYIIGKQKRHDLAQWLLRWLLSPGSGVVLLPAPHGLGRHQVQTYLDADSSWMKQFGLDYVDAYLMQMADTITRSCKYDPHLVIVTADLTDYLRCARQGYSFRVHHVEQGTLDFSD